MTILENFWLLGYFIEDLGHFSKIWTPFSKTWAIVSKSWATFSRPELFLIKPSVYWTLLECLLAIFIGCYWTYLVFFRPNFFCKLVSEGVSLINHLKITLTLLWHYTLMHTLLNKYGNLMMSCIVLTPLLIHPNPTTPCSTSKETLLMQKIVSRLLPLRRMHVLTSLLSKSQNIFTFDFADKCSSCHYQHQSKQTFNFKIL